jgi:hypothetical protein
MKNGIKQIVSFLLLAVFLLPSTGMMIYVHQCNMSSSIVYDTQTPKSCCSSVRHESAINESSCSVALVAEYGESDTYVSPLSCCDDSQMYIKLGHQILSQTMKVMLGNLPVLITSNLTQSQFAIESVQKSVFSNLILYPPGELPFILNSSLRL